MFLAAPLLVDAAHSPAIDGVVVAVIVDRKRSLSGGARPRRAEPPAATDHTRTSRRQPRSRTGGRNFRNLKAGEGIR